MTVLRCPSCGRRFEARTDSQCRPFCSERCQLIDLGAWMGEQHRIAGEPVSDDGGMADWGLAENPESVGPTH